MNFDFKGFAIRGKVISQGFTEGPSGIQLRLSGPSNLKLDTTTESGGSFAFDSIPPGDYILKASHSTLTFEYDEYKFSIANKNIIVDKQVMRK